MQSPRESQVEAPANAGDVLGKLRAQASKSKTFTKLSDQSREQLLTTIMGKKRKLAEGQVEELNFDTSARQEYLTGFHKRKQARIQSAREAAIKRDKEEKVKERKLV